MAPASHGRVGLQGRDTSNHDGPPPSTLAAQLVENISTTARSSRPDETAELKRFFSAIEKIKNQPDLLTSPEDRIQHNHMLIYVYTRVALEGPTWDNPFPDNAQLRADVSRAINFLKVTIHETPEVLLSTAEDGRFLFRGGEPLWIWVIPRLLKVLSCVPSPDINDAVRSLFYELYLIACHVSSLWPLIPQVLSYLRHNFDAIIGRLDKSHTCLSDRDTAFKLQLPPDSYLQTGENGDLQFLQERCSYTIPTASHALKHGFDLLSILSIPLLRPRPAFNLASSFYELLPWLLDAYLRLCKTQNHWSSPRSKSSSLLSDAVQILQVFHASGSADAFFHAKACLTVVLLCLETTTYPKSIYEDENSDTDKRLLCLALVRVAEACLQYKTVSQLVRSQLISVLEQSKMHDDNATVNTDFWRCLELLRRLSSDTPPSHLDSIVKYDQFQDHQIRQAVKDLPIELANDLDTQRQPKRRRVNEAQVLSQVVHRLWELLRTEPLEDLMSYKEVLWSHFDQLEESEQCLVIQLLGDACCAADATLIIGKNGDKTGPFDCLYCRGSQDQREIPYTHDSSTKKCVTEIFISTLQLQTVIESRRLRVTAMIALRQIARHCTISEDLDIEISVAAQWCLKSLHSSVRELRIAAARTLAIFLDSSGRPTASRDVIEKNRGNGLNILRSLSEQNQPHLAETCIMAWSHVAAVVPDEYLNLVLVKLVEYLGHKSVITSAAAFAEIAKLARVKSISPRQLFEPFWRYMAFSAVKDFSTRPKLTQLLAELMDMSVPQLLLYIQRDALPWLILAKRKDVIEQIAHFRNENEPWQPCLDIGNLGRILALLLTQESSDVEQQAMSLLRHISPHFDGFNLVELLQMEPLMTALELLKAAGDADEILKPQVRGALNQMASMILAASGETRLKKTQATSRFLQQHALGAMARLTEVINDVYNIGGPIQERRRCIKAMEELIRAGKRDIHIARPQIAASIQAAMYVDELRTAAFSCWATMLKYFEEDDIEVLIETTFFLINHYWSEFDKQTQNLSRQVIESLLLDHHKILEDTICKLPSLSHISEMSDIEANLGKLRSHVDTHEAFSLLAERISHDNSGVVLQALRELVLYLHKHQSYLQASVVSEQPDSVVASLARALLDCAARHNGLHRDISDLCTQCIGLMGCLDPNRVEAVRGEQQFVLRSNFEDASETTDFIVFLLEKVLIKSFISATDTRLQGYLSYAMQELLDRCDIKEAVRRGGAREAAPVYRKFLAISDNAREILSPFLTSRYVLPPMVYPQIEYPIFGRGKSYGNWMRFLTLDCLRKPQVPFAHLTFEPLCRLIRVKDLSIAEFLFPYLIVHVIIGEEISEQDRENVLQELRSVIEHKLPNNASYTEREDKKLYCEAVFRFLDYAMRWVHLKRNTNTNPRDTAAIDKVAQILDSFPAELISQRAVDCSAYSRALFYLEQHIRQVEADKDGSKDKDRLLQRLQDIYTQIDEPDGLEGISAHLQVLDINQQVLSHRKAGRWAAAQTWYEIKLAEDPNNQDVQSDLLTCLKESGQHDVLLNYIEGIDKHSPRTRINRIVPYAVEAAWTTGRWDTMQRFVNKYQGDHSEDFNVSIAQALLYLQKGWTKAFIQEMKIMRDRVSSSLTLSMTSSLQACHEPLLRSHILTDLELITGINIDGSLPPQETLKSLERRLEVLGSYVNDKQYILAIRRAAMELTRPRFGDIDVSSLWLSTARLARKANAMHQSFNAVLHASQLGDDSATIENARLLWKEGHNRKAIQTLQGAVVNNVFGGHSFSDLDSSGKNPASQHQNLLTARAQLLLAKWLDNAGQTHATALREQYRKVPVQYGTWEKGHYYLGRHYKKVLESEKALKPDDQSDEYLTGETAKLVVENYIRSLNYGTKYLYQTLPRILTLWLELAAQLDKAPEGKVSLSRELYHRRKVQLEALHKYLFKHVTRLPAYIFYTALPQLVARIAHPNADASVLLQEIIVRVVEAHPRQAIWNLFAIMTSKQATSERRTRGQQILLKLRDRDKKVEAGHFGVKSLLRAGEKLADQLLLACNNGDFQSNRTTHASITRDLNFNHKCTPCPLVVPIETCLTATLPTLTDNVKKHKAFSRDLILIHSFLDDVLVLGSLAKPRKLTARGTNGVNYGLLIKPKDDLRTDQRLMEFNSMINRSLKRDAESSRRQLYIRTYAVTPLNEECGIIEWVDGLKTLRDILLGIYRSRGTAPNYGHLQQMMKDAVVGDKNIKIFTEQVLGLFPSVLPNWFISQFPNPSTWFAARLRYTRSCAVMSMVGTILGLGDRHGENVLLEEGNGGVFHVDFNCLFDKGLTFAQPEKVPFRLTHNMVAAMGIYGYEGPFRKCSELTLSILRQQEETLMTILEAFIYDPTLDLQRDKRRKNEVVRLNPQSVVDSIKRKVRGLLPDESIPLGVEGQVEELIKQAVNPKNLSGMYIGWCSFL